MNRRTFMLSGLAAALAPRVIPAPPSADVRRVTALAGKHGIVWDSTSVVIVPRGKLDGFAASLGSALSIPVVEDIWCPRDTIWITPPVRGTFPAEGWLT